MKYGILYSSEGWPRLSSTVYLSKESAEIMVKAIKDTVSGKTTEKPKLVMILEVECNSETTK